MASAHAAAQKKSDDAMQVLDTLSQANVFTQKHVDMQQNATRVRHSTEQWLDENEREWNMLDDLVTSRPWALNRDKRTPYPFRNATQEMRDAGDVGWVGDDVPMPPDTRGEAPSDVLTHARSVPEFPPGARVILFTPEFGSDQSYDMVEGWFKCRPQEEYDMWVVCWQGWSNFNDMLAEVQRKLLSFGDGVNTIWFGHSMGAVVAYEMLKRVQQVQYPNFPIALMVSGCPAPHLFAANYRPQEEYPWLGAEKDNGKPVPLTFEQADVLQKEFSVQLDSKVDPVTMEVLHGSLPPSQKGYVKASQPTRAQHLAILNDLKMMGEYEVANPDDKRIVLPICAVCSDEDELVEQEHVEAWKNYTDAGFELLSLGFEDGRPEGHGFVKVPCKALLRKVQEVATKHRISKDINAPGTLPDIGPTDGPLPEKTDILLVGAGISGICAAQQYSEHGQDVILVDRYNAIGGIWKYYANVYSRVNTSEVGYRINYKGDAPGVRPNEDHTPTHDIMRDMHTVANKYAYGKFRLGWDVTQVEKQPDDTYVVTCKNVATGEIKKVAARVVSMCVNRRIGKRRDVNHPGQEKFRGNVVYGYANELCGLNFWGKKVIVVGAGAFAYENLRTAIEHGAKHATILGRRAGTTCPKWIDVIAFIRPVDKYYNTNKAGNIVSFQHWQECYKTAGLPTPDCWAEGLLKPHNHTVSVSDLVFIGGYHGIASLMVGEIDSFRVDGHGLVLKDGTSLDCDIVIKATGFHLNDEVPKITGTKKMHGFGIMGYNLSYQAEPLLDGGQFGSAKGKQDSSDIIEQEDDTAWFMKNQEYLKRLPPPIIEMFQPRSNPFGSGYVGGMKSAGDFLAWLSANEDLQKQALEYFGPAKVDAVQFWASQGALAPFAVMREALHNWVDAQKELDQLEDE